MIGAKLIKAAWKFVTGNWWRSAALALIVISATQSLRLDSTKKTLELERAQAAAAASEVKASIAAQRELFEAAARQAEQQHGIEMDELALVTWKEKQDAIEKGRAVADGLRADTIRLRQHWRDLVSTAELSRSAEAAARADERARLREEGFGDLVRVGAEADAQIRGLQSALESTLRICSGKG